MAKEHEVEELLGGDKVSIVELTEVASLETRVATTTSSTLVFFPFESISTSQLVVLSALLRVRQYRHGLVDALERLVCVRCVVLIWVHLQALLSVGFLQFAVIAVSLHAEHLVVVLAAEDFLCDFSLLRCELFGLGLWNFSTTRGGRRRGPL